MILYNLLGGQIAGYKWYEKDMRDKPASEFRNQCGYTK